MISCENLVKIYKTADIEVVALQGLNLQVEQGEMMAIIGNSGSGKSTLLNMLGGLDRPSAGKLHVDGKDMLKLTDKELTRYKRETVGFIWQNKARNLIPYLTARENVEIPMLLHDRKQKRMRAMELLDAVGLGHRANNRLEQLSGGEQQRVAIAIALANRPKLLLADEPTGALDTRTSAQIMGLLCKLNAELGLTIVIVTHDLSLAKQVKRVVAIRDGRTSSEMILRQSGDAGAGVGADDAFDTHIEYAVMDRSGRIQVPEHYLEAVGAKDADKVLLRLENDRIVLLPADAGNKEQ
ncbi:MAG: ABC transporter [Thermobacillus sp.]|uniref:ABC-type antimicrobial peptide transport system, ATPase component n=1 Tax=Thermobacillus composti (strain DSM 18247 / JCM 13945 / KWC4) TaxID=717605 RepID=L0EFD8_THECK|nr:MULTISPECIES: ATP-binding cassette domain-containing protein [Thermobacillus]AGA58391.1 ABC-type antimicrobial peptide transport system, ATPase component [Thermobacillus composti KWC4]REK54775.1 MAG: ABC transporter [Thermobacillus sp.]